MARVEIKGIDQVTLKFDKIAKLDLVQKLNKATALVHGQAKSLAPVDTGDLAGSIRMDVKKTDKQIQGRVYTNKEYAPYVEFGTGIKGNGTYPYKIKGLNLTYKDKGWAYWDEKEDKYIYTKGQVAQPYMYPALKRSTKQIKAIMSTGVKEELNKICKGGQ